MQQRLIETERSRQRNADRQHLYLSNNNAVQKMLANVYVAPELVH
jgi:hypothetical protein